MIANRVEPHRIVIYKIKNNPIFMINPKCPKSFQAPAEFVRVQFWIKSIFSEQCFFFFGNSFDVPRQRLVLPRKFCRMINTHGARSCYRRSLRDRSNFPFPLRSSCRDSSSSSASAPSIQSRRSMRKNSLLVEKLPFRTLFSTSAAIATGSDILMTFRIIMGLYRCNNLYYKYS